MWVRSEVLTDKKNKRQELSLFIYDVILNKNLQNFITNNKVP